MVDMDKVKRFTMVVALEGEAAEILHRYWLMQGVNKNMMGRELVIKGMKDLGLLSSKWDYMEAVRAERKLAAPKKKIRVVEGTVVNQRSFKHLS